MITCKICKSSNIEEKRWVNVNTLVVTDLVDEGSALYCVACGEDRDTEGEVILPSVERTKRRKLI